MTEKLFTYDSKTVSILKDGEFWLDGNIDTACNHSEICNELNTLHEENDELKQQLKTKVIVNRQYEELQRVKKENEQLRQQLQGILKLTRKIEDCTHDVKLIGDFK